MVPYGFTVIFAAMSILAIQQTTARQVRQTESSTIRTFANLSIEELVFIIKSRSGEIVAKPKRLTPCARAILSCCNGKRMNEACSESLQCGAFFFDDNPCEDKFLTDALENAKCFYEQFRQRNTGDDALLS